MTDNEWGDLFAAINSARAGVPVREGDGSGFLTDAQKRSWGRYLGERGHDRVGDMTRERQRLFRELLTLLKTRLP